MGREFYVICLFIIIPAIISVPGSCAEEADIKEALYINSYDFGFTWSRLIADGVYDGFSKYELRGTESDIYVHTEFLDSKFISDAQHFFIIYNLFSNKFWDRQPDVIIVSDDNALLFIQKYGEKLFPGIPVVFTGINNYESLLSDMPEDYTGIIEKLPIEENIDLIISLHPSLETIYVVTDDTYSGKAIHQQTDNISKKFNGSIDIRYPLPGLGADEMIESLSELPEDSAVLFITYNTKDSDGDTYYSDYYVDALSNQELFPVYTVMDQYNQLGVTGGYQISPYELGKQASDYAVRILEGTNPKDLPVELNPQYITSLNYEHIKKFDLRGGDIPPGTHFFNTPPSTVTIPAGFASAAIIVLVLLSAILFTSLVYYRKLKITENELNRSLEEKNVLLREVHHRVKNNLAIISSLVTMQAISSNENETKQKLKDVGSRLISMSVVHDTLYLSENLSRIDVHNIFVSLGEGLIQDYGMGLNIDLEVSGGECLIRPDQAIPVSLVLNEIICNSIKFAFDEKSSGKIRIDYSCNKDFFKMTVSDNGKGIPEQYIDNNDTDSIGLNLIRTVIDLQLNGTAEVSNDSGTRWSISFPVNEPEE